MSRNVAVNYSRIRTGFMVGRRQVSMYVPTSDPSQSLAARHTEFMRLIFQPSPNPSGFISRRAVCADDDV